MLKGGRAVRRGTLQVCGIKPGIEKDGLWSSVLHRSECEQTCRKKDDDFEDAETRDGNSKKAMAVTDRLHHPANEHRREVIEQHATLSIYFTFTQILPGLHQLAIVIDLAPESKHTD